MIQKEENRIQEKLLEEVIDFIDGDRGTNYPSQGEFFSDGHCLFLSTKNIPNTKFSFEEKMFIDSAKDSVLRKWKLKRGDYVLTTRGTVGNFAYYNNSIPYENIRINSGMVILRKKNDELIEEFFQYYLSSSSFSGQVKSRVSGSAQPQLPIRDMVSMKINLPSKEKQIRIASILSSYDNLIENNLKRIKIIEEMAQLLYYEWFVKFNFPGHESVEMAESNTQYGKIPKGWEVKSIWDLLETVRRKNKLQTNEYSDVGPYPIVDQWQWFIAWFTNDIDSVYNETLIVFGDHSRCFKYCNFPFASWADGTQLLKSNDSDRMPQILLYYSALNAGLKNYNYARHFKFLKVLNIIKPDKDTATKFAHILNWTYDEIKQLQKQNATLAKTRDLLIPQLVTGKRKLK